MYACTFKATEVDKPHVQVSAVFQCFKGLLAGGKARRQDLDQRRQGEDFDDEEAEAMEVLA